MNIYLIAALGPDGSIGVKGDLIWHLKEDMRYFRNTTMGHAVLMGRRTFESIGKALPGRHNTVISRHPDQIRGNLSDVHIYASLPEALAAIKAAGHADVFVMGGAQIYAQCLPLAAKLYLTDIRLPLPEGKVPDAFFPPVDKTLWKETYRDDRESFSFLILEKIPAASNNSNKADMI